jgi:type II secretory pathway component GspD/PulD (secretin)
LEQLRRLWPSIQANPLQIETPAPDESVPGDRNPEPQNPPVIERTDGQREARLLPSSADSVQGARPLTSTAADDLAGGRAEQINWGQAAAQATALAWADPTDPGSLPPAATDAIAAGAADPIVAATTGAPIQISVDRDGRLLLRSRDTRALDRLEELIDRIAPPRKDFEVFYLKHASASLVTINLEDYFEEDAKDGSTSEDAWWAGWYGYGYNGNTDSSASGEGGLSQRKPLRFIWDFDTNSILVSNATPDQLSTIRSLIEIYDRPISEDSISARRFQIFKIQHARATDVAATIKDVYRDLLSSKDKVFERNNGEQKEQSSQSTNYIRVFGSVEDTEKKPTKVKASFAGALSVGIDEVSNTVIISAQEEWMPSISEMIRYLDVAAEPYENAVQVVHTNVSGKALQAALSRVVGGATETSPPKEPEQKPPAETPPNEAAAKPASAATPATSQ